MIISVTMQYVHFIQNKFPQHELNIFNIAQKINGIEKNQNSFGQIINAVKTADGILWAFPLYCFFGTLQTIKDSLSLFLKRMQKMHSMTNTPLL